MVAHLMAAGVMAATALGVTHDCEPEQNQVDNETTKEVMTNDRPPSEEGDKDESDNIHLVEQRSGRFANKLSASSFSYRRSDGGILLDKPQENNEASEVSHLQQDDTSSMPLAFGFVQGNFGTGKVRDVAVPNNSSCYTVAYHPTEQLLAIGLREGLAIYETCAYTLVHLLELDDMVSAISWEEPVPSTLRQSTGSKASQDCLLVIGTLDGLLALYSVNVELLECHGPSCLYHSRVPGQIRALSTSVMRTADSEEAPTLLIAVGTKAGNVTMNSLPITSLEILTSAAIDPCLVSTNNVARESSAVLGLDLDPTNLSIAWCTKAGQVVVRQLSWCSESRNFAVGRLLWCTNRQGPVRSVLFSKRGSQLAFGGYDKKVLIVDTQVWAMCRQLTLQGTVNTLAFDPKERYLMVGTRDKMFRIYDTSTFVDVKTFHTPGWVTSISWMPDTSLSSNDNDPGQEMVAIRSDNSTVSILNLSAISLTPIRLSTQLNSTRPGISTDCVPSLDWTANGRFLVRCSGSTVIISDVLDNYKDACSIDVASAVVRVACCPANTPSKRNLIAVVDASGTLSFLNLTIESSSQTLLRLIGTAFIEENLKALSWSRDGGYVVTGGRGGRLHFMCPTRLKPNRSPVELGARIWDVDFVRSRAWNTNHRLAVALGNYTVVLLNDSFDPSLRIVRSRTVRCVSFHPTQSLIAVGDGDGTVAIVDYGLEEVTTEFRVNGRVNVVAFSPVGDYLLIGTDGCVFQFLETGSYHCLQQVDCGSFAVCAAFSPLGTHLALGNLTEKYSLVRLGPFLGIDLVPIGTRNGLENLTPWALREVLFRSSCGPSLVQRHMIQGGHENLTTVVEILRHHPDALYAFNRATGEGCFDSALALKRPNLMRMAITMLVDGTLDAGQEGQKSILTTNIPERGRRTLMEFIENHPPDFIVSVLNSMSFTKVPFTRPHLIELRNHRRLECSSSTFMDPWFDELNESRESNSRRKLGLSRERCRGQVALTPAVLPLPGLGELELLSRLLLDAPPSAFDNDAMALVLGVMWRDHVRKYFVIDCLLFLAYYTCWVVLLELAFTSSGLPSERTSVVALSLVVVSLNSLFLLKEVVQSGLCCRKSYFVSLWNWVDVSSIVCIYIFVLATFATDIGVSLIPLAVVTTLLLTIKVLSYLRGFSDTGWLISVLAANFRDVRGFLLILFSILFGFAVTFRLLFGGTGDEGFDSLRRSFLSTFEITILGTYDGSLLYNEVQFRALSTVIFILAVTCVLVVALNALISILGDSYAKVQEHATANRRNERAALIVEYLTLLPSWHRKRIEDRTKWFHVLLEVDAQDNLLVKKDDWEGGLNAVRRDLLGMEQRLIDQEQKIVERVKSELDDELRNFKKEVLAALSGVSDDLKRLHTLQSEGGITFSGKNVAKAVRAVKSIRRKGGALLNGD